ncbi:Putative replication factor C subunit [Klebsormidium nitens]|uniref:Replication factor C subunit 1 n=1 Tax=Klebsormidium nitens TaxID=105231 RepID=A0A1Y1INJ4_KLENI|nr:Putative replication factor C subunit [Klebsormidium nitens]|eukprot:GAQ91039.1 Putative replication factor C subunit [Klebsormidium nitens]
MPTDIRKFFAPKAPKRDSVVAAKPEKQDAPAKPPKVEAPAEVPKRSKKEETQVKPGKRAKKEEPEEKKAQGASPLESFRNKAAPKERKRPSDTRDDVKIVSPPKKQKVKEVDEDELDEDEDPSPAPKPKPKPATTSPAATKAATPKPSPAAKTPEPAGPSGRGAGAPPRGGAAGAGRGGGRGGGGGGRGWGGGFGQREAPPHKGEKDVPEGKEDALKGLTFVISGVLDSLEREEAEDLIKRHGGRVTGSISKKTSYLLADEDVGGKKSQKAKELGTPFLTEDGLFDILRASKPQAGKSSKAAIDALPDEVAETVRAAKAKTEEQDKKAAAAAKRASAKKPAAAGKDVKPDVPGEAWVHRYAPQSLDDMVGNQTLVKQLKDWLESWEQVHNGGGKGKKKVTTSSKPKAALLSGDPGIGKTTAARLVCQQLGFHALEVNASDSRSKADAKARNGMGGKTSNIVKEMVTNTALAFGMDEQEAAPVQGKGKKKVEEPEPATQRRPVLIMDEVDGMSGGDRGGVADLIASIKTSKIPIICICNDRYSQKIRSLTNYCLQLNWRKPTKQQMSKRLGYIAQQEGLTIADNALEELAERVNGDMRMAINQLQYMALLSSTVSYGAMKARLTASAKDEDVTAFSAVDKLLGFEGGRLSINARLDLAMQDADLEPLIVQENYLNYGGGLGADDPRRLDVMTRAADAIADGDVVNGRVRRYQQWGHMPFSAFNSTVLPATYLHGRREVLAPGERNFNRFGGWLGKNSTQGKNRRLLEELRVHVLYSKCAEPTSGTLRLDYLSPLSRRLTEPLRDDGKEGVEEVVELMEEYGISQEDYDTALELTKFKDFADPLKGVPAAVKSHLTRTYKGRAKLRHVTAPDMIALPSAAMAKKKTKKVPARLDVLPPDEEGRPAEDEALLEGDEDENDDEDAEQVEKEAAKEVLSKLAASNRDRNGNGSKKNSRPAARAPSSAGPSKKRK